MDFFGKLYEDDFSQDRFIVTGAFARLAETEVL